MKRIRVAIDMAIMRPGVGGTGSGIWTYAERLLDGIDAEDPSDLELCCFLQRDLLESMSKHRNIRFIGLPRIGKNIVLRVFWNHIILPLLCLVRRIDVLHKLATETPLLLPCRCVTTIHDFYYDFLFESGYADRISGRIRCEKAYFSAMQKIAVCRSSALITVSDTIREETERRYPVSAAKIHVVHHGAPLRPNRRPLDRKNDDASPFTFLYLAKFMPYKGQHLALDALRVLGEREPDLKERLRLTFRGFENDRGYYESLSAQASGLVDAGYRVEILPYDPDKDIAEIYRKADALLFLSAYEGFGLPVIEAQQMGLPVLCSDIPILREVGGDGARYVDRNDATAVADEMYSLISDDEGRRRLIQSGENNLNRFEWRETARKTLDLYKQVSSAAGSNSEI